MWNYTSKKSFKGVLFVGFMIKVPWGHNVNKTQSCLRYFQFLVDNSELIFFRALVWFMCSCQHILIRKKLAGHI